MNRLEFCCGCVDLEKGGRIIAWFEIIFGILGILIYIIKITTDFQRDISASTYINLGYEVFLIILFILSVIFAIIFLSGINNRNNKKIRMFRIYTAVNIILFIINEAWFNLTYIALDDFDKTISGIALGVAIHTLWNLYEIFVAYSIEQKFNEEGQNPGNYQQGVVYQQPGMQQATFQKG